MMLKVRFLVLNIYIGMLRLCLWFSCSCCMCDLVGMLCFFRKCCIVLVLLLWICICMGLLVLVVLFNIGLYRCGVNVCRKFIVCNVVLWCWCSWVLWLVLVNRCWYWCSVFLILVLCGNDVLLWMFSCVVVLSLV